MDSRLSNISRLLDLPRAGATSEAVVWHYTSRDGLESILATHQVLASDAGTMNDVDELVAGHAAIAAAFDRAALPADIAAGVQEHLDFAKEVMDGGMTFVLSASTHEDNVSLWQRYTNLEGYAIGLKTTLGELSLVQAYPFTPSADDEGVGDINQYVSVWRDVVYDPAAQTAEVDAFIDLLARLVDPAAYDPSLRGYDFNELLVRAYAPSAYSAIVTRLKGRAWDSEDEVRITAVAQDAGRFHTLIGQRNRVKLTGCPTPKGFVGTSNFASPLPVPLPIVAVRTGPNCGHTDLRDLLDAAGYTSATTHSSAVRHR